MSTYSASSIVSSNKLNVGSLLTELNSSLPVPRRLTTASGTSTTSTTSVTLVSDTSVTMVADEICFAFFTARVGHSAADKRCVFNLNINGTLVARCDVTPPNAIGSATGSGVCLVGSAQDLSGTITVSVTYNNADTGTIYVDEIKLTVFRFKRRS